MNSNLKFFGIVGIFWVLLISLGNSKNLAIFAQIEYRPTEWNNSFFFALSIFIFRPEKMVDLMNAGGNESMGIVRMSEVLFSKEWDFQRTTQYMQHSWVPFAYKLTLAYLAIVYFGQKWMAQRKAFDSPAMSRVLAVWNFAFSIFSGYSAYCLLPELVHTIKHRGFIGSYCHNGDYYENPVTGFWGWMFVMSKAPELGDTLFLIARKRPVIFLHWYHHALTFLYATITYAEKQAWCRWSLALNLSVHTVMYFYFALQALRIRTPRPVAKFITSIQILQFIISCYIFVQLVRIKSANSMPCEASWNVLSLGALMYLSYLYLFGQFFYDSYISPKGKPKRKEAAENGEKIGKKLK